MTMREFPHMCRDGHEEIGFRGDDELCPVCRMKSKLGDAFEYGWEAAMGCNVNKEFDRFYEIRDAYLAEADKS